jgi:carboxymethylenebutenolidase
VGFSLGGFWALELIANHDPQTIKAMVLFYGNHPGIETPQFAQSGAAFLGHFAEDDEFDSFEEVLQTQEKIQQAGKTVTYHQYPGTKHWFAEANQPDAYHAEAAELAWARTLEFLNHTLK